MTDDPPPIGAHPLDGVWAKIARAGQHIITLERVVETHCEKHLLDLVVRQAEDGSFVVFLHPTLKPPIHFAAVLGDIASNLRSALDQLAWQLALRELGDECLASDPALARRVSFPIQHTEVAWEANRASIRALYGDEPTAVVESLQPFTNEGLRLANPLAVLQAMTNTDKHRVRMSFLAAIAHDDIQIAASEEIASVRSLVEPEQIVTHETPLLEVVPIEGTTPDVRARIETSPVVCFLVEDIGLVRVDQLRRLGMDIADGIGRFDRFFTPIGDLEERLSKLAVPHR